MQITHPDYYLPEVYALRYDRTLGSGANKPILSSCLNKNNGKTGEYVIKIQDSERMDSTACFRELLSAFFAMQMGIPVAEPAIAIIGPEFVDSVRERDCFPRVANSLGINYSSAFIPNHFVLPNHQALDPKLIPFALDIFWFDFFIQNTDRTIEKQNMFTNGKEIVIFDHELALGFLLVIFGDVEPWVINRKKWSEFGNLFLPPKLKGQKLDEERIAKKIELITDDFWTKASALIPPDWFNLVYFEKSQAHVALLKSNIESFVSNLQILLL